MEIKAVAAWSNQSGAGAGVAIDQAAEIEQIDAPVAVAVSGVQRLALVRSAVPVAVDAGSGGNVTLIRDTV